MTQAIRVLKEKQIPFVPHEYPYEERGGTKHSSECLKVSEHIVIKTLVMETDDRRPLIILMHGDCEVSTKQLARDMGVKTVRPCDPATVQKLTGYQVGGTSPFGTRKDLPIYAEASILALDKIVINGGKRGFLVEINPADLRKIFDVKEVQAAIVPE
ncbi:MAG TPA: Cys-tRNA(Pro) deacylase [Verrucomicrobia bacterium]|nr:MAG: aminoacyl-tRNA deacylase [Lentisphaerae bacterium GWF2_57_35]HBA82479.1 Cys-tRNA(Pro) deacylase [Verrucomicrobiota bacterium]